MDHISLHRVQSRSSLHRVVPLLVFLAASAPLHVRATSIGGALPDICASMSSGSGTPLTLATAGVAHSFTITARDETGIPVTSDAGATFAVRLSDQRARASVRHVAGTGTYVGTYDATASGVDKLSLMLARCECFCASVTCKTIVYIISCARVCICAFLCLCVCM
jgi:hypothetical protein